MKRICPKCFKDLVGRTCGCGFVAAPNSEYMMALPNYVLLSSRYVLLQVLGAGGFGVTYKALDCKTKKICAIKEYVPVGVAKRQQDGRLGPDSRQKAPIYQHAMHRFMEEAYILQELNAMEATATITDCFEENGTAYFVMEYVHGQTLKQEIRQKGKIPVDQALQIVSMVAGALDKIHQQAGIFHRDISPENLMRTPDGSVKILDFGSAKFMSKQASQQFTVVLKAGYAPPEQYSSSSPQGAFTDVYALASTFYYMITGRKIPDAPDRINGKTYVPLLGYQGITPEMSAAVDRALQLDRKKRTQSCGVFRAELCGGSCQSQGRPPQTDTTTCGATGQKNEAPPASGGASSAVLILRAGTQVQACRICSDRIYCMGRNKDSDILLPPDMRISGLHCYVYYDKRSRGFSVKDVSRNGIRVRGRALDKHRFIGVPSGSLLDLAGGACLITLQAE